MALYVTADPDEGPIIVQEVAAVTHADMPDDLVREERNIEQCFLARAIGLSLGDRMFLNDQKMVVFDE